MRGSNVCYHHGGAAQNKGIANGNYKHGRRSKYLPERLLASYHESLADQDLIALRDELALLDSRLGDLLSRVDTGEAGRIWADTLEAWETFREAQATHDPDRITMALNRVDGLLRKGVSDYAAWNEIHTIIEQRRKLSETERRRLVDMHQMITAEQAMSLIAVLLDSVRRHVSDRTTLAAIQTDVASVTGRAA